MTPRTFAIVGLRLLGVYLIADSLPLFTTGMLMGDFFSQLQHVSDELSRNKILFSILLPGALQVLEGILLFIFSAPFARYLIPSEPDKDGQIVCSLEEVQAIAFAVTGILITVIALPDLGRAVQDIYYWYYYQQQGGAMPPNQLFQTSMYSIGVLLQVVIGIAMLFNAHGMKNAWRWLRTAGTKPSVDLD